MNRFSFLLVFVFLFSGFLSAQESEPASFDKKNKIGLSISGNVSRSGLFLGLGPSYRIGHFQFDLAPTIKAVPSTLGNMPFGFMADVIYYPLSRNSETISPFVNLNYHLIFIDRLCVDECSVNYNQNHDITIGYGFSWRLSEKLFLSNAIHIGIFIDRSYSTLEHERISRTGINGMLSLKIHKLIGK